MSKLLLLISNMSKFKIQTKLSKNHNKTNFYHIKYNSIIYYIAA